MFTRVAENRRGRSGITLTEILISIMILGIGIISLATLFPIGLVRLRNAQRSSRSAFLCESAAADLSARNLLAKFSFISGPAATWYSNNPFVYDPWVQDTPAFNANWGSFGPGGPTAFGVYRGIGSSPSNQPFPYRPGPGLPVAYDPLWRAVTNVYISGAAGAASEARFGSGIGFLRNDPNPGTASSLPSAHGLQRVTNLPTLAATFLAAPAPLPAAQAQLFANQNYATIVQTFVSPEDLIFQDPKVSANVSPVVPDMSFTSAAAVPSTTNDWRFTWIYTGQRSDASNGSVYDGDIVIFENRQFAIDSVAAPFANPAVQVMGETVVEAAFGYSTTPPSATVTVGYANSSGRSVLLRWPATLPDPDIHVGGFIADVTYERNFNEETARSVLPVPVGRALYPLQRCYWYQIAKKSEPMTVPAGSAYPGDPGQNYRTITVWVSSPLRAKTPIDFTSGQPFHVEAALIAPGVVNVFPRTVYTR